VACVEGMRISEYHRHERATVNLRLFLHHTHIR
jgi:hypothetical protein